MSHSACTPHAQRTHVRMYVYMSKECHQVLERIQRRVVHWTSVHIKWIAGKKILASTPMTFVCTRNGLQKTIKLRFQVMQTTLSQSTQTHIHTHILAHTYTYTHTHTHTHTYKHTHTQTHTHTHTHTNTHTHTHTHTHIHTHTHTRTHTHTSCHGNQPLPRASRSVQCCWTTASS